MGSHALKRAVGEAYHSSKAVQTAREISKNADPDASDPSLQIKYHAPCRNVGKDCKKFVQYAMCRCGQHPHCCLTGNAVRDNRCCA